MFCRNLRGAPREGPRRISSNPLNSVRDVERSVTGARFECPPVIKCKKPRMNELHRLWPFLLGPFLLTSCTTVLGFATTALSELPILRDAELRSYLAEVRERILARLGWRSGLLQPVPLRREQVGLAHWTAAAWAASMLRCGTRA